MLKLLGVADRHLHDHFLLADRNIGKGKPRERAAEDQNEGKQKEFKESESHGVYFPKR
jgi:hypothetical protein